LGIIIYIQCYMIVIKVVTSFERMTPYHLYNLHTNIRLNKDTIKMEKRQNHTNLFTGLNNKIFSFLLVKQSLKISEQIR
jgi:hypothetical protein